MSRKCSISGKGGQYGNRVSHANNKTKHTFDSNVQEKRFYLPEEKRYVRLKVSTRIIRTIDKIGLTGTLKKFGLTLKDVTA